MDVQSVGGWTFLHRAAAYGTAAEVEVLIGFRADDSVRIYNLL